MIVIVDSGGANLVSITSAFERLGCEAIVSAAQEDIEQASHVILPGVGSAKTVMARLQALNLVKVLQSLTQPVLGICVGMQILFEYSEEGATPCLGLLNGRITKIPSHPNLNLPHMGWNTLKMSKASSLMRDVLPDSYVYFVHSYMAPVSSYTLAQTDFGEIFSAAVRHDNFWGVQFHPERSGKIGQRILTNFLKGIS